MGKIILEFDSVEEAEDARTAIDGWKYKLTLWDLDQELRSRIKYAEDDTDDKILEAYDDIRCLIRRYLEERNLELD